MLILWKEGFDQPREPSGDMASYFDSALLRTDYSGKGQKPKIHTGIYCNNLGNITLA